MSKELFDKLQGGLIVSCQALPNEPLYKPEGGVMVLMAKAALESGAIGIRAQGIQDINDIRAFTDVPLIGIIKKDYEGYAQYITATMAEVDALVTTQCDIIALDATNQTRGDGLSSPEFIKQIKMKYPHIVLMGDISTVEEGIAAVEAGIDCLGTTLSGYTPYTPKTEAPDFKLIQELKKHVSVPIIAEGRLNTPELARQALEAGADCVTVGGAITRPQEITKRFVEAMTRK